MSFSVDLKRFEGKATGDMRNIIRRVVIDVFSRVILKTPVGQPEIWANPNSAPRGYVGGNARGSWQFTVDYPAMTDNNRIDSSGTQAIGETTAKASAWDCQGAAYLVNLAPYIRRLEYGWSHVQAPNGMVRVTLSEFPYIVEQESNA